MERIIVNSSKKNIGKVIISENEIVILNNKKPELTIVNKELITHILKEQILDEDLIILFDDYTLLIGEVAAIYNISYSRANKYFRQLPLKSSKHSGRRNSSYGKKFTEEHKQNISKSEKQSYQKGRIKSSYERTPEIREKISNSLKVYFKLHPQNPQPHRDNWKNGKYSQVNFKRGIGGFIFSIKNQKRIFFRSLLELYYMLQLEQDDNIKAWEYESVVILCDDNSYYTPDFKIDNQVIELKSLKGVKNNPEVYKRFLYKTEQGKLYCKKNNLNYQVIFDVDLNFETTHMKKELQNHPEIIEKYQIKFLEPERVLVKK